MNSKLYGNKIELPEEVIVYLGQCFDAAKGANDSTEGYKDRKSTRLNSSHVSESRMPSSA